MLSKKGLFGNHIDPACGYCEHGSPTRDGGRILCPKMGVVAPHFHCKKYIYAPLKRVPTRQRELQKFDKSDFEL